jgi:hypothetical protein
LGGGSTKSRFLEVICKTQLIYGKITIDLGQIGCKEVKWIEFGSE